MRKIRLATLFIAALLLMTLLTVPATGLADAEERTNHDIVFTATDIGGREGLMRRGYYDESINQGFGADKAYYKHGIDNFSLFTAALKDPQNYADGPTSRVYNVPVGIMECDTYLGIFPKRNSCQIDEDRRENIKLVMDYRTNTGFPTENQSFGVVTIFCNRTGAIVCPSYVNDTVEYPSQGAWPF